MAEDGCPLKFLFAVRYRDQTEFVQPNDDLSTREPPPGQPRKSAWADVKQDEVELLALLDLERGGTHAVVDLRDGHFEAGGVVLTLGDNPPPHPSAARLRPIFFRQHQKNFNLGGELVSHTIRYCIGWQATIDGRNVQQVLGVY